jgi:hypothetical protein
VESDKKPLLEISAEVKKLRKSRKAIVFQPSFRFTFKLGIHNKIYAIEYSISKYLIPGFAFYEIRMGRPSCKKHTDDTNKNNTQKEKYDRWPLFE